MPSAHSLRNCSTTVITVSQGEAIHGSQFAPHSATALTPTPTTTPAPAPASTPAPRTVPAPEELPHPLEVTEQLVSKRVTDGD